MLPGRRPLGHHHPHPSHQACSCVHRRRVSSACVDFCATSLTIGSVRAGAVLVCPRGQFADNQRELREAIKGVIEEAEVEASGGEAGMGLGSSLCATWTWTTMERVEGWVCDG